MTIDKWALAVLAGFGGSILLLAFAGSVGIGHFYMYYGPEEQLHQKCRQSTA